MEFEDAPPGSLRTGSDHPYVGEYEGLPGFGLQATSLVGMSKVRSNVPPVDATLLTDAVFRLERAISRIGNKRLDKWSLSLSGYAALKILQTRPDLSLAQLSRRCFVRPQTMTRIVSQLEDRGYVRRGPHPESDRAIALALTDVGEAAISEMDSEVLKINETLAREMDPDGLVFLDTALRRCAVAVEAELREM